MKSMTVCIHLFKMSGRSSEDYFTEIADWVHEHFADHSPSIDAVVRPEEMREGL